MNVNIFTFGQKCLIIVIRGSLNPHYYEIKILRKSVLQTILMVDFLVRIQSFQVRNKACCIQSLDGATHSALGNLADYLHNKQIHK